MAFQGPFFHQIDFLVQQILQIEVNLSEPKQPDVCCLIQRNQNIHIAFQSLLTTGVGAKQPCFQHWLRGKISLNFIYHQFQN